MDYQNILFDISDGIATLTLNRPDKLNSFTQAMHEEVRHALRRTATAAGDGTARVLVLTGAGRGFCAGQDLSDRTVEPGEWSVDLGDSVEKNYAPLVQSLRALPLPVIGAINGVAAGAGANIALACDIVLATKSASFVEVFCKLGLIPDTGGTYFLPRLVGSARAMGLALLGEKLTADKAEAWGLIWKAIADEDFAAEVQAMAGHFASAPTKGLAFTKQALHASAHNSLQQQLALECGMMSELGRSDDYREGVAAFMEKRAPQFKGR
ncbi:MULTISPECIES: 2-(1,2-epoxy-1,2-dihydrophenyl)acetyl-CoA isomerase PaaG [unclassified Duganella]|uniref:2-(1,2-epoxy-1,2-dihydrophenyl)acetyl-CoA isomerase PaaG n=1 Tax=unclassified Duganella TaxID=2636909 RepID=UPI000889E6CF|nr:MULTISPECIES: 2-(1,2-epoxy-1,2-dihydrophenyl)acetyl-CoA isomerase PaaG [unclassified Duganella]SDG25287.1 2-(1,2-epoxy-1,2-dihydrophenyl)acetyl-CoA isomerase [Duganella sp. OV458]SDJ22864.1 2-(1,2-epoxy-1,2-dihydrophenyl)acetyl-CoA isomerase [Duganella sp. OV510]